MTGLDKSPSTTRSFRSSRLPVLVVLAVCGFFGAGLVVALWNLAVHGKTQFDVPWPVAVLIWVVIAAFAVAMVVAVVLLLAVLVSRPSRTTVSADSLDLDGRGVITLANARAVTFYPGDWKTWGTTKPGDPRKNLTVDRKYAALTVSGGGHSEDVREGDRAWPYVVATLRGWVARRPELATDDDTRLLLGPGSGPASPPVHRPSGRIVYAWSAAVATALTVWADSLDGLALKSLLGDLVAGLFWGGLLMLFFMPLAGLLLAIVRTTRHADLWRPFLPDAYGTHDWLTSGTVMRATRVQRPKGHSGLVWRWVLLALGGLMPVLLPLVIALDLIARR